MSPSPFGTEGALLPGSASWMEKLVSGYCTLKRSTTQIFIEGFFPRKGKKIIEGVPQKRLTKIALGAGGALSTARPLGNNVRPLGVVSSP